jgi:hypothetical protein
MAIQDTDAFLVERGNVNYQTPAYNLMAIQDTDLLAVNRGGTNYKVTGLELKDYKGPQVVIYSPGQGEVMTQSSFNIESSVWYSQTGVTHVSSTWSLALSTDPTFSNPVKESVNNTTELTSWFVSGLTPGTSYLAKVTYNLSNSSSVTSSVASFSVAASASPFIVTPPSSLVSTAYDIPGTINQYVTPVAMQSLRYSANPGLDILIGATTSGRLLSFNINSPTIVGSGQLNATPLPNGDLAYDAFAAANSDNTYYINQEGLIKSIGTPLVSLPATLTSQKIVSISPYDQYGSVCIRTASDEIWVVSGQTGTTGADNGTIPLTAYSYTRAWTPTDSTNFTAPSGEKPIKVISYQNNYVVWLTDAKNAYLTSQFSGIGNDTYPLPLATSQQGIGATRQNPVKIRPYPFGSAPDYQWEDIFGSEIVYGAAIPGFYSLYSYGFWGYLSDGRVRGAFGWATSFGPDALGYHGTSLGSTDPSFWGDQVILGATGSWSFKTDPTVTFGTPNAYVYDSNGNVFVTPNYVSGLTPATVLVPGVGPSSRSQPISFALTNHAPTNYQMLQTKPVDQS